MQIPAGAGTAYGGAATDCIRIPGTDSGTFGLTRVCKDSGRSRTSAQAGARRVPCSAALQLPLPDPTVGLRTT